MIAYKGFRPGLICRGYQFVMGLNTTEKANCRENGFHCAEDPLDCLSYYSSLEHSEYYIVNAGGDIDEDEHDSKIACTELTVIKRLTKEELFLHGWPTWQIIRAGCGAPMWQPTGQWRTAAMRWYGVKTPLPPADWETSLLLRRKHRIRKVSYRLQWAGLTALHYCLMCGMA